MRERGFEVWYISVLATVFVEDLLRSGMSEVFRGRTLPPFKGIGLPRRPFAE